MRAEKKAAKEAAQAVRPKRKRRTKQEMKDATPALRSGKRGTHRSRGTVEAVLRSGKRRAHRSRGTVEAEQDELESEDAS